MLDKLLGSATVAPIEPVWILDTQVGFPLIRSNSETVEFASTVIFALRIIVGLTQVLTKKGILKRSISEDQASVYTQFANMMSTAGIDGSGCLQYIICELAQREAAVAQDQDEGTKMEAEKEPSESPKKASEGGSNKKKKKKKSKKSKSSLMADIVATLLLPKERQPLVKYVEAADTAVGASCGEKYPGCPVGLSTVLDTILGRP